MKIKSMRGELVDFAKYIAQNEEAVAVGNARMNARGDIIGPGGTIVKKREEIAADYHRANPRAVKHVSIKDISAEIAITPEQAVKQIAEQKHKKKEAEQQVAQELQAEAEQIAVEGKKRKIVDSGE
jgi:hypothetical protein